MFFSTQLLISVVYMNVAIVYKVYKAIFCCVPGVQWPSGLSISTSRPGGK